LQECLSKFKDASKTENGILGSQYVSNPEFDSLLLIDRNVDMLTPMRTQLTYEGLIDELFGIQSTFVELDAQFLARGSNPSSKTKKHILNSKDPVFAEIRDLSFEGN
jgi:vacuolar protein sorting-associated protein 33A